MKIQMIITISILFIANSSFASISNAKKIDLERGLIGTHTGKDCQVIIDHNRKIPGSNFLDISIIKDKQTSTLTFHSFAMLDSFFAFKSMKSEYLKYNQFGEQNPNNLSGFGVWYASTNPQSRIKLVYDSGERLIYVGLRDLVKFPLTYSEQDKNTWNASCDLK